MFRYDRPILFLKASIKKTITVPGYYRHDGTYVAPHTKVVNVDPDKEMHHVISGQGTHSQKEAHKKLSKLPGWADMSPEHQHAHILSAAQNIQTKASKAAQVSVWKKDMLAGNKPKAANITAFKDFMEQEPEKAGAMLAAISEKIGWEKLKDLVAQGAIGKKLEEQAAPPVEPAAKPAPVDKSKATQIEIGGVSFSAVKGSIGGTTYWQAKVDKTGVVLPQHYSSKSKMWDDLEWASKAKKGDWAASLGVKDGDTDPVAATPHFGEKHVGKVFVNKDGVRFKFDGEKWLKKWDAEADWTTVNKPENIAKLNEGKDFTGSPIVVVLSESKSAAPSATPEQAKVAADKVSELVAGTGGHYPVLAAKKLTGDGKWQTAQPVEQLQMIVDLAKQMQAEATASAAVSGYKKAIKEGKVPSKAQTHAFHSLPEAKQLAISQKLVAEGAHPGNVASLKHQALVKHGFPVKSEPPAAAPEPAAPAKHFGEQNVDKVYQTSHGTLVKFNGSSWVFKYPDDSSWSLVTNEKMIANYANGVDATGPLKPFGVAAAPEPAADAVEDVLHHTTDGHNKFWSVAVAKTPNAKGKFVVTKKWGKIGTAGQSKEYHYNSFSDAFNDAIDWKADKKAKGYYEVESGKKPAPVKPENAAPEEAKPKGEVNANGWDFSMSDPGLSGAPSFVKDDWYIAYSPEDGGTWEVGQTDPHNPAGEPLTAQYSDVESAAGHLEDFGIRAPSKAALAGMADAASLASTLISPKPDDGPKDGDTKPAADGGTLVFHDGHWHKQDEPVDLKAALDAVPVPQLPWKTAPGVIEKLKAQIVNQGDSAFKSVKKIHTKSKWGGSGRLHLTFKGASAWGGDVKYVGYVTQNENGELVGTTVAGENVVALYQYVEALKAAHAKVAGKPKKGAKKAAPKLIIPATQKDAAIMAASSSKKVDGLSVAVMDKWQQTGGQQGSNPGGTYKDGSGQEWYVKFPKSMDHAKNELLAAKLYAAAGVHVPKLRLVEKNGKIGIASKIVPGVSKVGAGMKNVEGALEGFAVDAWLGNYDSVGTGYDNLLKMPDGKAIRIDVGGSLIFRAQGALKTDFGDAVNEIDTMRDAKVNSYAAAVFGGISKKQLDESVALVLEIPDDVIQQVVDKFGPGSEAEKKALAAKLIARKNDLAKKFPEADAIANPPKPDPRKLPVEPSKLPTKPDFFNWNLPNGPQQGKPVSSVEGVNKANQQAVDAIYASALKGDFVALKKLQFDQINKQTGEFEKKVSFGDHKSQHVKDFYSTVLDYMEVIANPAAKKMKVWDIGDYSDIEELSDAFKAHFYGVTVGDVPANQRLGFWISLGQADAAQDFMPKNVDYISAANRKKGQESNAGIPKHLREWMKAVKVSGSANQPYRDGKEVDTQGNKTRDVLEAAYKHAVEFDEGTRLTKGITVPDAMMKQLLSLEPGHVFQNPGSMCTSMKKNWSWSGGAVLHIVCAKGAKGLYNVGVGSYDGEDEVTTIPGQRFMLMKSDGSKTPKEFTLLMLPPDETYVANIHPKG